MHLELELINLMWNENLNWQNGIDPISGSNTCRLLEVVGLLGREWG